MVVAVSRPQPGEENLRKGAHRVDVEPTPRRVRVVFNGQTIADSKHAVLLRESNLLPVYYFPPEDVRSEYLNGDWEAFNASRIEAETRRLYPNRQVLETVQWSLAS